jgi:HEAT repeat protein
MENKETVQIVEYLKRDNLTENEIIEAIRGLGDTGEKDAYYLLISMLKDFDKLSWRKRNAIALAIGDLGFDEGVPYLMNIIKNPNYDGYNGSFLYALTTKPLNCKEYFLDIIELLCTGDLEIREAAIILIESFYKHVTSEVIKRSLEILAANKVLLESGGRKEEKYDSLGYIEHAEDLLMSINP